ncbi:MAG: hypothetical protein ABIJ42_09985 [Acidobacteriota bacterium]
MSEKRNGAFLFLVLLLFGTFFHTATLAETSGEDRLVVFEVFRNYTDVKKVGSKISGTFQSGDAIEALRKEFAGQDVLFLEYDWNDAYSPATIRGSRFAHAKNISGKDYSPPFAMVDSGQQILGGDPGKVNYETDYRSMILASQARPPKADLYAVARRAGGELIFDVVLTNRSGVTISGAQLAYVQVILYEEILDKDDDSKEAEELKDGLVYDQCTEKVVHSFGYARVQTEVPNGGSDTYTIMMNEPSGVEDWSKMRALVLVDYTQASQSKPYDLLQAVDVGITEHVYFAHFGAGGGLTSDIILTNPSDEYSVEGVIEFRDANGQSLDVGIAAVLADKTGSLDIAYSESGAVPSFSLSPYETIVISTGGAGPIQVGSVDLSLSAGESTVGGALRFSYPVTGTAGVSTSEPLTGFVVPIQSIDTGIAIHNTEFKPVTLKMSLYEDGELVNLGVDSKGKPRNPVYIYGFGSRAHVSKYIDEYFPTLNRQ